MCKNYPLYSVICYDTIPQMIAAFRGSGGKYGDDLAAVFYDSMGEESSYSFRRIHDDVLAFASGLAANGLAGRHVAIISENRYEWLVAFCGVICTGGVAVCVDIEQAEQAIIGMVKLGDSAAVACSLPFANLQYGSAVEKVICFDSLPADKRYEGAIDYSGLIASPGEFEAADVQKDTPAAIFFTSGTTNASKPVLLSNYNIMHNACNAQRNTYLGPRMFTPLPFYHTYSLISGMIDMLSQGKVIGSTCSMRYTFRDILRFKPYTMLAVPLMADTILRYIRTSEEKKGIAKEAEAAVANYTGKGIRKFCKGKCYAHPGVKEVLGESIEILVSGGAHLSEDTAIRLSAYGLTVVQGYGITECSPLISANRNEFNKLGSVGVVLPGLAVKIDDDGEICVSGPSVALGYYNSPELTAEAFKDGWFMTGDIGYIDKDGFIYISGRKKSLIVFNNGKKIAPEEIEAKVQAIPFVKEVVAYGSVSGQSADEVKLAVMVHPDPEQTAGMEPYEILDRIQQGVDEINHGQPPFRKIQIVKLKETPFERTATKKIKREGIVT